MNINNSENMLDRFFSVYLDTDIASVHPQTLKVVATERRKRREVGYGFIHVVWILLCRNKCIVSTQPQLQDAIKKLFSGITDFGIIREKQFHAKLVDICIREGFNKELLSIANGLRYICLPCNFVAISDANIQAIVHNTARKIRRDLSEGGVGNLDSSITQKTAFAYFKNGLPVAFCLTHDIGHMVDQIGDIGGIFTSKSHRGRGYAKAVLSATTKALIKSGRVPTYGTSDTNLASQATAKSVGYTDYAWQMSVKQRMENDIVQ